MTNTLTSAEASDLFRRDPDRYIDVGAGDVAYRRVGTGPHVLFVHGWPVSGATFRCLLPHLADHVTCHVVDLPGAGASRFDADTTLSFTQHIESVRRVIDALEFTDYSIVGHDSGGMIARFAVADDDRLRSIGLINSEQPQGLSWRFKMFLTARHLPGFKQGLGWVAGQPRLRRNGFVLGDAFADRSHLDGEFDEFFLKPLHTSAKHLDAAMTVLKSVTEDHVKQLGDVHKRITAPVQMVWGAKDPFFPVQWAQEMVDTFPNAQLDIIDDAGLFSHEERPADVAQLLLPALLGELRLSQS